MLQCQAHGVLDLYQHLVTEQELIKPLLDHGDLYHIHLYDLLKPDMAMLVSGTLLNIWLIWH